MLECKYGKFRGIEPEYVVLYVKKDSQSVNEHAPSFGSHQPLLTLFTSQNLVDFYSDIEF